MTKEKLKPLFHVVSLKNKKKTFISLTPQSDLYLISPYNITPESNIRVMRIKEMMTN